LVFKQIGSLGRLNPDLKLWQSQELDSKYLNSLLRQKNETDDKLETYSLQDAELARKRFVRFSFRSILKKGFPLEYPE